MKAIKDTMEISIDKSLLSHKGKYKALFELSCKHEKLRYECNDDAFQIVEDGKKLLMNEWQQPGGLQNSVEFKEHNVSIFLTKRKDS